MKSARIQVSAYSLLELVVAATLLTLVGVLFVQVTGATSRAAKHSTQKVETAAQARLALDRIGMDIAEGIFRRDVDCEATNTPPAGGSFLTFLSGVSSADPATVGFPNRRISLVSYRIAPSPETQGRSCLLRAGKALSWSDAGFMGLHATGPMAGYPIKLADPAFPAIGPNDFDVLSPAVFKAVIGFQLRPDDLPVRLADGTAITNSTGQVVYSPPVRGTLAPGNTYIDCSRIASIIVGLALIDPEKLSLADDESINALSSALATLPNQGQLPVSRWMSDTGNLANLPATIPLPIRQSVRLYQRFFPLPPQ